MITKPTEHGLEVQQSHPRNPSHTGQAALVPLPLSSVMSSTTAQGVAEHLQVWQGERANLQTLCVVTGSWTCKWSLQDKCAVPAHRLREDRETEASRQFAALSSGQKGEAGRGDHGISQTVRM